MNHILHQCKKDLFRLRTLFLLSLTPTFFKILWISVLLGSQHLLFPFLTISPGKGSPDLLGHIAVIIAIMGVIMGGMVMTLVTLAIPYLIIPMMISILIHEDPLVGTTSFWITRPVSRQELFFAKLLLVSLMVLTLVVGHYIPLNFDKFKSTDILDTLASFSLKVTTAFLLVTLLSVITENLRSFLIYLIQGFLLWLGSSLLVIILRKLLHHYAHFSIEPTFLNSSQTQTVIWCLFTAVASLGLIYHQFITRRTSVTVRWAIVALFISCCLGSGTLSQR